MNEDLFTRNKSDGFETYEAAIGWATVKVSDLFARGNSGHAFMEFVGRDVQVVIDMMPDGTWTATVSGRVVTEDEES